jgi:hypothetical protein
MRIHLLLTMLFSGLACARPTYVEGWPDSFRFSGGAQPGFAIKQVIEKQRPVTLLADDGSVCRTSRERFFSTKEGALIACIWNLPSPEEWSGPARANNRGAYLGAADPEPSMGGPHSESEAQGRLRLQPGLPPEPGVFPAPRFGQLAAGQAVGQLPGTRRSVLRAL